ncbi:hypothetical protein Acr_07g0017220 [Actinidia rufa]|uniref:Uncharacterized protein n=1 Tax=Actinidia rufa TaxID=165716 RepID=A0A7J0EZB8_9ERIC|nr:hypothetical protein Acr_07g0017220 [Actinidia rufa]
MVIKRYDPSSDVPILVGHLIMAKYTMAIKMPYHVMNGRPPSNGIETSTLGEPCSGVLIMSQGLFGKGVKQQAWAKSLHHGHNYNLITRGLNLSDQSIYGDRRACAGVDGVNLSIQISNLLGGGFFSTKSFFPFDGESEIIVADPAQYYGGFGIRYCQSSENGEEVLEVQEVAVCLQ